MGDDQIGVRHREEGTDDEDEEAEEGNEADGDEEREQ
jgi:hypothetical protein